MRNASVIIVLMLLSPIVAAISDEQEVNIDLEITDELIIPTYSKAIQYSFKRVSDLNQYSTDQLSNTEYWLVVTQVPIEKQVWTAANPKNVEAVDYLKGAYIWYFEEPLNSIEGMQKSLENGQIETFSPLVENIHEKRDNPNDPEFSSQWHLDNYGQTGGTTGEDINATDVWDNYRGEDIVISIIDDGLDHQHPDIAPNYNSSYSYDWCNDDSDPTPNSNDGHGTAAAGVAAATGNNSLYVAGAAWEASLAGSTILACGSPDSMEADALSFENNDVDIYSNSWGPSDNGQTLSAPGPLTMAALEYDAYSGRNGLGNSITWAAGNGLTSDDNANYDGYANSRFTIAVTAITHYGEQSYYAEPGANILVAAHSNGDGEGITTTDITGNGGYTSGNVTNDFGGTSSATPLASGVIALMYDANKYLTWRDVQEILVQSSRKNDPNDSSWNVNGAGYDVSHKYGFGAIDAGAAVDLALNWTNIDDEMNSTYGPYLEDQPIPNNNDSWTQFQMNMPIEMQLESVDLMVDIDHNSRGDLDIVLVSPDGTESWLAEEHNDNGNDYSNWLFNTVHHWGESSLGMWTLKIRDSVGGNSGTINSWEIIFHGIDGDFDHDDDGLSDENETNIWGTDPYDYDSDDDGLSDYDEVILYGTNPLIVDTDIDGLTDEQEVNSVNTNPLDSDSDDDGLSDGVEVNYWNTDPLVYDPDADSDLFYHFQDCDDNNPSVNPGEYERLDGLDNDCDGVSDEGYNLTDRDNDGINDWPEYHIHGTDYLEDDTDGDNLTDGEEILIHGSDPLDYDPDEDSDGFQWFLDCDDQDEYRNPALPELLDGVDNNCDLIIDNDFWNQDSDFDGLNDYEEFHNYSTDPYDGDSDDDGLPDGNEVNFHSSDPLYTDPDNDQDGWYWFQDCQDDDAEIFPLNIESLDKKDNDCDDQIDEDFYEIDSDDDGINDYDEYHNITTDPNDSDSDDDGLKDGYELLVSKSNPLVFDFDRDEDGFYEFEDCEDINPEINPGSDETWNNLDDDCNGLTDDNEDIDRDSLVISNPERTELYVWDSGNRSFSVNLDGIPSEVEKNIVWEMEGIQLSDNVTLDGQRLHVMAIDCKNPDWDLAVIFCQQGDGVSYLNATIFDSNVETNLQWMINVKVHNPPPTLSESLFDFLQSPIGIIVLIFVIMSIVGSSAFVGYRIVENRRIEDAYREFQIDSRGTGNENENGYSDLPSAPDLSAFMKPKDDPPMVMAKSVISNEDQERF